MLREPLLKMFRAIATAEAVGQDRPEQMTVLRTSIFTPACLGLGGRVTSAILVVDQKP